MTTLTSAPIVDLKTFDSGAGRDGALDTQVRYDLITPYGLRRLAQTYAEGAQKYGDRNWEKGIPFSNLLNHIENHLALFKMGDTSEDHLAHAAWGLFAMLHFQAVKLEMDDLPRQAAVQPKLAFTTAAAA